MVTVIDVNAPIKVSSKSRVQAVAGAIAGMIRDEGYTEVQAIGAGAVNQSVKALAVAVDYLKDDGISIVFTPTFVQTDIGDERRTAIRFRVESTKPQ